MITRRTFFGGAIAAPALLSPVKGFSAAEAGTGGVREEARNLPIAGECDVLVAGGGPAGIATAVTAARGGAKVTLIEAHGALGGIWTSGLLSCLIGFDGSDLDREILARLDKYGARHIRRPKNDSRAFIYEPEYMKLVCEEMCAEAGVRVRLYTSVVAALRDPSGRNISAVVTESKSGREAWRARRFVDCTGDGDLGALAGCGFDVGGDAAGALSLARYHMDFAALLPGQLEVWDIVNIRRPMSETAEKILKLKADMEGFARQTVTGFIHNSNLQDWASAQDLRDGYPVIRQASLLSGIPVVCTAGRAPYLDEFLCDDALEARFVGTPLPLEPYMKRSWSNFTQGI
jgi:glycine/D-amino acid oxidase-like deaminating enzyme